LNPILDRFKLRPQMKLSKRIKEWWTCLRGTSHQHEPNGMAENMAGVNRR
jgi:hypothetical protein